MNSSSTNLESQPRIAMLAASADRETRDGSASPALRAAVNYLARGWAPIPIPHRSKAPKIDGWEKLRLSQQELPERFAGNVNVGVLLGEQSGGIVDVDLDHPMAVELAPVYLPRTTAIFGRASKQRSHWLYKLTRATPTKKFKFPKPKNAEKRETDNKMIVEFRGGGCQTVFPGSVHESGEPVEWAVDGEPSLVDPDCVLAGVEALACEVRRRLGYSTEATDITPSARTIGNPPADAVERARKYLATIPPAVSGHGGHDTTFHVACVLILGFGLDREKALLLLGEWNQACQPPWAEDKLEHKIDDALKQPGERGYLLGSSTGSRLAAKTGSKRKTLPGATNQGECLLDPERRTDLATARRLAARSGQIIRWCEAWKKWIVFDGKHWRVDVDCRIESVAKEVADEVWREIAELLPEVERGTAVTLMAFGKRTASANGIRDMLILARSEPGIAILPDALDCDPWLFNVENGTLNLKRGELQPHCREDFLTKLAPVVFDPDAQCPLWSGMVDRIMDGNRSKTGFLKRLAGYSLTGVVREHALAFLYGVGANGKSTFLNTLMAMFGEDYAMKAAPEMLMVKRGESHPTERADLFRKRLVCCIETEDGRRMAEALVKELTGGDKIRARRLYENFWEFEPTHTIWLAANHRPVIRGTDTGVWRRVKLIPFNASIPDAEQDKALPEKLLGELSGILNWALSGCMEWQADGLKEPDEVTEATGQYRCEMDIVAKFIDECCVLGPSSRVAAGELYAAYAKWCEVSGEFPVSGTRFGTSMAERGFEKRKVSVYVYQGIGLVCDVQDNHRF